jgi:hypothetical protein
VRADQVLGPLTLATRNKNITLDRVAGTVSVTNSNGDVDVTVAPPLGNVTVDNRHGSVNVNLPEKAAFTVQAETTNGDAENDFSLVSNESDNSNRKTISGTVGQGGPLIRINTSQGDIALKKASVAPMPPKPPAPPPLTLRNNDGSQVIIGKDGVNISGADGSFVMDKGGVSIRKNADGSSVYTRGGTKLVDNVDGSRVFTKPDGTTYTRNVDGSKVYVGRDGTRITLNVDGSRQATGPNGRMLSDAEVNNVLNQAESDADRVAADRDRQAAAMRNH